ncbi:class I SAM-dependent methyltransferase [Robiginitalea marina]|uniref:Class I SAM-dependent methyltransferase n=1 Tax=Robiginitalea marina TaxID=2954105 RepID=A0ABT1AUG1_9FLAO|nr:class I SAM-dependent methyltransferase [Robiginitalea marina]MCO5723255.1 class I SAM-dependent methyltransferase [Robiginitalea marina]
MKTTYNTEAFDRNVADYEAWYEDNPGIYASELGAIREHFNRLPESLRGIEIGLGTGRFAGPLGIREGVEPSPEMARKAVEQGIEVMDAMAENLPYADLQFDFVLFVTVCHLQSLKHAFLEANRVLKKNGFIIIGFLPSDRPIARAYQERRRFSTFYRDAVFYTPGHIEKLLEETGFKSLEFNQVLFGEADSIKEEQFPRPGFGEGSFVVVSAQKA